MKILRAFSLLLVACATPLGAATPPLAGPAAEASASVQAVRALITRCLPSISQGRAAVTTGFFRVPRTETAAVLGTRTGEVWSTRDAELLLVSYLDAPVCRVLALNIDAPVMADLVIRVFSEAETPFRRDRFRMYANGGFAAVYSTGEAGSGVVVRISTVSRENGTTLADLSVERFLPDAGIAQN